MTSTITINETICFPTRGNFTAPVSRNELCRSHILPSSLAAFNQSRVHKKVEKHTCTVTFVVFGLLAGQAVKDTINVAIKFQQPFAVRERYVNHRFGSRLW